MTELIQQPKRKPGRPRKVIVPQAGDIILPGGPERLFGADDPGYYTGIQQPMQAVRFKEAAPIGFANRAETSASTSQDGRMHVSVDWSRRVVVVLTKEGSATCETLIPLENVKSMRPVSVKASDAA